MSGTLVCYTFAAIATREISYQIDTPSILFIRSIVAVTLTTVIVWVSKGGFAQIQTRFIGTHVTRNCIHFVGQFGWFFAIASIPLAHVFALEFTVPIWIALMAPIFLRERLTLEKAVYIFIGFIGILIIVRPFGLAVDPGAIAMLVGAIGFAGGMLFTRHLTRTETPLCILFYMAVVQLPISAILLISTGPLQIPDAPALGLIVLVTLGVMTAHYCMARAFLIAEIIVVIPLEYIRLPIIVVFGALLYEEPIDAATIVGGLVILAGNYLNVRAAIK